MRLTAVLTLSLLPGIAAAQGFVPPEGCTSYLTVQTRSCVVEQHYTCTAHPGERFRMDFGRDGAFFLSRVDAEAQWLSSTNLPDGRSTRTLTPVEEPASITELLEARYDAYRFDQIDANGRRTQIAGWDRLTGEEVIIDGEPLLRTEFGFRVTDAATGEILLQSSGREFVSPRLRRFFSGERTLSRGEASETGDFSPVTIRGPGQPGFGDLNAQFGCGDAISALPRHTQVRG